MLNQRCAVHIVNIDSSVLVLMAEQITFQTTSFGEIDKKIAGSSDVIGTVQNGWRREKNIYFSEVISYLREHLSELKEALNKFMGHERHR